MKFEYKADVGYIYLVYPIKDSVVKNTVELIEDIILDFSDKGKIFRHRSFIC